jgi:hypothetical protein
MALGTSVVPARGTGDALDCSSIGSLLFLYFWLLFSLLRPRQRCGVAIERERQPGLDKSA